MSSTVDTAGGTVRSPVTAVATAETGWQGRAAARQRRHVGDHAGLIPSVFLEVCRDASGFDPPRSSARTWVLATLYRQVTAWRLLT